MALLGQFHSYQELFLRTLQVDAYRFGDSLLGVLLYPLQQPPDFLVLLFSDSFDPDKKLIPTFS